MDRFEIGVARRVREGHDLTIAATGGILEVALDAARELSTLHGLEARVLSVHTTKPLDIAALTSAARETGGVLTLEEHTVDGGFGGAVAEVLLERGVIPRAFLRMGLRGGWASAVGSQAYLRRMYGLDKNGVVANALKMLNSRAGIQC
jgi:transketolase